MSNERPNEFLSWRGQLTAPDALPEQGVDDREQSWQRLAERLQKQPRRRGIAWWIAAACLILAFFFPASHLFRARPTRFNRVAQRPPVQRQPVTFTQQQRVTRLQPAVTRQAPAHRSATALATSRHPLLLASARASLSPLTAFVPAISAPAIAAPVYSPALPAPLSAPKKQLKVVCYNEINNPASPPQQIAGRESEFFRISLGRMPNLGSADPTAQPNDAPFLTIKLIPKNN
jgi:hypothetical protein